MMMNQAFFKNPVTNGYILTADGYKEKSLTVAQCVLYTRKIAL